MPSTNRATYYVGGFERSEPSGMDVSTLDGLNPLTVSPELARQSPAAADAARRLADAIATASTATRWGEGLYRQFSAPRRTSVEEWRAAYEGFRRDWVTRTERMGETILAAYRDYADALRAALVPRTPTDAPTVALLREDLTAALADAAERHQPIDQALHGYLARGDAETAVAASAWGRSAVRRATGTSPEAVDTALDTALTRLAPEHGRGAVTDALHGLDETWRTAGLTRWALDHRDQAVRQTAPEPEPAQ